MYIIGFGLFAIGALVAEMNSHDPNMFFAGIAAACAGIMIAGFKYYFL